MNCSTTKPSQQGFTLVELLVALAIVLTIAVMGMPTVTSVIHRSQMEGFVGNSAFLIGMARVEAVKRQVPTVVVLDQTRNELVAFADLNDDGVYNPDSLLDPRASDYLIGAPFRIPTRIFIWAPEDAAPKGANAVKGFTAHPDTSKSNQIVFEGTGTVRDVGAYRFGDQAGNFLEIRVSPRVSARIDTYKWDTDQTEWFAKGEDGNTWRWY